MNHIGDYRLRVVGSLNDISNNAMVMEVTILPSDINAPPGSPTITAQVLGGP